MPDQDFVRLVASFLPAADRTLTVHDRLRDLGLDSIHSIDLLMAIEDRYDIEFPAHLLTDATFDTPTSLWSVVEQIRV